MLFVQQDIRVDVDEVVDVFAKKTSKVDANAESPCQMKLIDFVHMFIVIQDRKCSALQ